MKDRSVANIVFTFHSEKKVGTGNVTGVLDIETKQGWRHMIKVIGEGMSRTLEKEVAVSKEASSLSWLPFCEQI